MTFKQACKTCGPFITKLVVGFFVGYFIADVVQIFMEAPAGPVHCRAENVDDYYFQKLETFVDPRDSNEYTVLKFAEYQGCLMSERDSGFLAGDTVTFHLFLENLRYKTDHSRCLDSTCERGRYYPFGERAGACPAGWTIASAIQNAGFHMYKGGVRDFPTMSPVKVIDRQDPSGLKSLRARPHDGTRGWVDTVDLNLSGFYNVDKEAFEYVDSLSVVWTSDAIATVITPNDCDEQQRAWVGDVMSTMERLKPYYLYPIRCIRIDDPHHKMDDLQSGMVTYYNNMRGLPYLFR